MTFLDGVRGFACLYVALHHCSLDLPASASASVVDEAVRSIFYEGHYAVDVFIVLSGYCLMLPVLRAGGPLAFWQFIRRRAIRILPAYYAAMAFSLVLIATLIGAPTGSNWDASLPVSTRDVVLHLLVLHEWSGRSMFHIASPFWSIGVEWKIYFLMPMLVAFYRRYGAGKMAVLALFFGYGVWAVIWRLNVLNPSPYGSSPYYVALFVMGMWAADLSAKERAPRTWATTRWAFGALSVVLLALTVLNRNEASRALPVQVMSGFMGLWAAIGIALLHAGSFPVARRFFSWRPLVYVGHIGFTVYLIHAPIAQVVGQYIIAPSPWSADTRAILMPPIFLACTLAVAVPFFKFFENPFHALSRHRRLASPNWLDFGFLSRSPAGIVRGLVFALVSLFTTGGLPESESVSELESQTGTGVQGDESE